MSPCLQRSTISQSLVLDLALGQIQFRSGRYLLPRRWGTCHWSQENKRKSPFNPTLLHRHRYPNPCPGLHFPRLFIAPRSLPQKTPAPLTKFMNRNTNLPFVEAFDPDDRLKNMENMMSDFQKTLTGATSESDGLREICSVYKARGRGYLPTKRNPC